MRQEAGFSLFRETDQDDSISYRDWCAETEATLAKGYEPECIKTAMFKAMEDMAKDHAANIDQYGVLTTLEILEGLDWLYGMLMTFQLLNAALCGLQQRASKTCHDYYDCLTQITVLLRERHSNHFHPGELARMSKDCFYAGLWAKHRPMVVHLKDHPNSTPLDLIAALMENEQNDILANIFYPLATSSKAGGEYTMLTTPGLHTRWTNKTDMLTGKQVVIPYIRCSWDKRNTQGTMAMLARMCTLSIQYSWMQNLQKTSPTQKASCWTQM